jgi:hypothetical protein
VEIATIYAFYENDRFFTASCDPKNWSHPQTYFLQAIKGDEGWIPRKMLEV